MIVKYLVQYFGISKIYGLVSPTRNLQMQQCLIQTTEKWRKHHMTRVFIALLAGVAMVLTFNCIHFVAIIRLNAIQGFNVCLILGNSCMHGIN